MKTVCDLLAVAIVCIQEVPLAQADGDTREASVLIDVREQDCQAAGHLPGSVHPSRADSGVPTRQQPGFELTSYLKMALCRNTSGRFCSATRG